MLTKPIACIRLGCTGCDRDDGDGITRAELVMLQRRGWKHVARVQTWEQSVTTYPIGHEPPGYSVLDWWTHLGVCPECLAARGES